MSTHHINQACVLVVGAGVVLDGTRKVTVLDALCDCYRGERHRASPWLQRAAHAQARFLFKNY